MVGEGSMHQSGQPKHRVLLENGEGSLSGGGFEGG